MKQLKHIFILISILYITATFAACSDGIMGKGLDSPVTNNLTDDPDDESAPVPSNNGLITATSITSTSIVLKWQASTDTTTAQLNLVYAVYQSTNGDSKTISEWESETLVQDYKTGSLSVTASELSPNTTYYFNVIVRDSAGNKALYTVNESATTAIADTTVPVPGSDGIIIASDVSANSLILNWTDGTDNITESRDLQYAVYQSATDNISTPENCETNGKLIQEYTRGETRKDVTGLLPDSLYYFTVIVKDSAGNKAVYILKDQKTENVKDTTAPIPGNSSTITTSIVTSSSVNVMWTESIDNSTKQDDLQYAVYESLSDNLGTVENCESRGTMIQDFTTSLTAIWVTGLKVDTTYYFNVVVKDSAGNKAVYAVTQQSPGNNYVKLSQHAKNSILHGKEIFEAVIKKYKKAADWYEAGAFAKLVNTNLLNDASKLTPPEYTLFNYDQLKAYGDLEIITQYEDGTTQALPRSEILAINGNAGYKSELYGNGKKTVNFLVKREDAVKARDLILGQEIEKLLNCCQYSELTLLQDLENISTLTAAQNKMQSISSSLVSICQTAGYIVLALDTTEMTGITNTGTAQDGLQEQAINEKLGHIITLLGGVYTNLVSIENRLNEIQNTLVTKAGKQPQLDYTALLKAIKIKMNGLKIAQSILSRKEAASQFAGVIDNYLLNYTAGSEGDWVSFTDYKNNQEKSDTFFLPLPVKIELPHRRYYTNGVTKRIECTLTAFTMINPNCLLLFSPEGWEYLKKLYTTRFGLNSIIETDEKELNKSNSAAAAIYLNDPSSYIGKLRTDIQSAYNWLWTYKGLVVYCINYPEQKCEINPNIFWCLEDVGKRSGPCTVKDNLVFLKTFLSQNRGGLNTEFLGNASVVFNEPALNSGSLYDGSAGLFGGEDFFNYTPYFSFTPFSLYPVTPGVYDYWTKNDFPYPPAIIFGGVFAPDKIDINRAADDISFLDNAVDLIDIYYRGKSGKLLEFAASLAALEIQTALYLDADSQAYRDYISAP